GEREPARREQGEVGRQHRAQRKEGARLGRRLRRALPGRAGLPVLRRTRGRGMTTRILLAGQRWLGAAVFNALRELPGLEVAAISAPADDRLGAQAALRGVRIIPAGTLNAATMPEGIDLIVAAHSHDFIGERTRLRARLGAIGYHPSLLPLHRGRDAVRWTIRDRDRIAGGTVYRLNNRMDGGPILAQGWC